MKTKLSCKGYTIRKSQMNPDMIESLKKELTVSPKVCPGYGSDEPVSYKIYKENDSKMYLPFYYGKKKYGSPTSTELSTPIPISLTFSKELRDYQTHIVATYRKHITPDFGGGIISVGCGRGKTVMGLKIIQEIGVKTLIIVHKDFLMNQWRERIEEYLPDARIGFIQGKTLDIVNKDIIIGMIQSLSDPRKDTDYPKEVFQDIGLLIADECHHLAAKQFCRSLMKYTFKYTLGLSATPTRLDGLTKVFKLFLGDIIYRDKEIKKSAEELALEHIPDGMVSYYQYLNTNQSYCKTILNYQKKPQTPSMETQISKFEPRNQFILSLLPSLVEEGRKILILSSRREHIFHLEEEMIAKKIGDGSVGLYLGGMKQRDLDESTTKKIIIATFDMAEEAFDCKALNTLILSTPKKNIIQAVGRIMRQKKSEQVVVPHIIDIVDNFSNFKKWSKQRKEYYLDKKYPIKVYDVCYSPNQTHPNIHFQEEIKPKKSLNIQDIESLNIDDSQHTHESQHTGYYDF